MTLRSFKTGRSVVFDVRHGRVLLNVDRLILDFSDDGRETLSANADNTPTVLTLTMHGHQSALKIAPRVQLVNLTQQSDARLFVTGENFDYSLDEKTLRFQRQVKPAGTPVTFAWGGTEHPTYLYVTGDGHLEFRTGLNDAHEIRLPDDARAIEEFALAAGPGVLVATLKPDDRETYLHALTDWSNKINVLPPSGDDVRAPLDNARLKADTTYYRISSEGTVTRLATIPGIDAGLASTSDGTVAATLRKHRLELFDPRDGKVLNAFDITDDTLASAAFSPTKTWIAFMHGGAIDVRDWKTSQSIAHFDVETTAPFSFAFSADGDSLLKADGSVVRTLLLASGRPPESSIEFGNLIGTDQAGDVVISNRREKGANSSIISVYSKEGKEVKSFDLDAKRRLTHISPQGRYATAEISKSDPARIQMLDIRQGTTGPDIVLARYDRVLPGAVLVDDHARIVLGIRQIDGSVSIQRYDGETGKFERTVYRFPSHDIISLSTTTDETGDRISVVSQEITGTKGKEVDRLTTIDIDKGTLVSDISLPVQGGMRPILSPDGKRVAILIGATIKVFDVLTKRDEILGTDMAGATFAFSADGAYLLTEQAGSNLVVDMVNLKTIPLRDGTLSRAIAVPKAARSRVFLLSGGGRALLRQPDGRWRYLDMVNAESSEGTLYRSSSSTISSVHPVGNGLVAAVDDTGVVTIWKVGQSAPTAQVVFDKRGPWVVATPDERFDTDSIEAIESLHWVRPDHPMVPLPLELYMSEYFEPDLLRRTVSGPALAPIPSIEDLEFSRPLISSIRLTSNGSDAVDVSVDVSETREASASSEVHDLRLFRDGRLVGWKDGAVQLVNGKATLKFQHIRFPQGDKPVVFEAYAFNRDQVKGDANSQTWSGSRSLRHPKAVIVSVGVDLDAQGDAPLHFAANDAQDFSSTLAETLRASGKFDSVTRITLIGNSTEHTATPEVLKTIFGWLRGEVLDHTISDAIPDLKLLPRIGPDDAFFLSFSGHASSNDGRFSLLMQEPPTHSVDSPLPNAGEVRALDLADWLRPLDVASITLVIDACHSATSVEGAGFKPGPGEDRSLGQVAYSKRARVLVASQSDEVAREDPVLQHGLLTYALIYEGLKQNKADFAPRDGRVFLSEWLQYGAAEVPTLAPRLPITSNLGNAGKIGVDATGLQQPRLFDFANETDDFVLKAGDLTTNSQWQSRTAP